MQIYRIVEGPDKEPKWEKTEFLKFPNDFLEKPFLNAIMSHLEKNDKNPIGLHWIVFSKEEEDVFLERAKIFVVARNKSILLDALCDLLKQNRLDAPFVTFVAEDIPVFIVDRSRLRLALQFGRP